MTDNAFAVGSPRPVLLAERCMKARTDSRCALDNCAIHVGDRIGLVPGTGWAKVACIVSRQRQTSTEE